MTVSFNASGARSTYLAKPADTNAATIYTAPTGVSAATVSGINIAATGAASATVWYNDGATDYLLLDAKAVSANTSEAYTFGNPVLLGGYAIKVKTSSANNLTFALTMAEEYRQT